MSEEGLPKPDDQLVMTIRDFYQILTFLVRQTLLMHEEGLPEDEIIHQVTTRVARACMREN